MICTGIDIGSRNTKLVVYDHSHAGILYSGYRGTDVSPLVSVQALLAEASQVPGMPDLQGLPTAVTGYGRKLYKEADKTLSEIVCHAAGTRHFHPSCRTVIDIGGQDSKVLTMDHSGKVKDFVMNDKCAAGTGRFLEMTAMRLGCTLDELSALALSSTRHITLNSTCVVFAESEIIGLMAQEVFAADIAQAVNLSIAKRISAQVGSLDFSAPVVFTGGVAQNAALAACIAAEIGFPLLFPPDPEITGALGAAILAYDR